MIKGRHATVLQPTLSASVAGELRLVSHRLCRLRSESLRSTVQNQSATAYANPVLQSATADTLLHLIALSCSYCTRKKMYTEKNSSICGLCPRSTLWGKWYFGTRRRGGQNGTLSINELQQRFLVRTILHTPRTGRRPLCAPQRSPVQFGVSRNNARRG